jgi:hypothetical protein
MTLVLDKLLRSCGGTCSRLCLTQIPFVLKTGMLSENTAGPDASHRDVISICAKKH